MDVNQNIATLFEQLDRFFKTETVFGEAMQVGNVSLIPVISISFGAGTGAGSGKDAKGSDGSGGGGGAGGKITPTAVIVVRNEEVSVLPLSNRGYVDKIVEMVPELIDRIPHKKPKE
ncbi:MAG: spore germination protein GerW family protein [Syntrophomonas sp.]|uniref:GerW family sporulation protein n=1 Tax=Syntrophomonas sp. TaxID=2053627 RepID=UPI0026229CEC|nr:spore germination protein GerW family protein [Syntrophomonas sp.]MDD2510337.1 spore germination protein GerW family protein [Syntrophomonas sp.]MDD4625655.1 spore germination protein GerW family protein [Syntrophomonas sp.]